MIEEETLECSIFGKLGNEIRRRKAINLTAWSIEQVIVLSTSEWNKAECEDCKFNIGITKEDCLRSSSIVGFNNNKKNKLPVVALSLESANVTALKQ